MKNSQNKIMALLKETFLPASKLKALFARTPREKIMSKKVQSTKFNQEEVSLAQSPKPSVQLK